MRVVTVDEMRRIEAESEDRGVSTTQLMENAGLAVAEQAPRCTGRSEERARRRARRAGATMAETASLPPAHLDDWGARVHVYVCGERPADDPHLETLRDRVADVRVLPIEAPPAELRRALTPPRWSSTPCSVRDVPGRYEGPSPPPAPPSPRPKRHVAVPSPSPSTCPPASTPIPAPSSPATPPGGGRDHRPRLPEGRPLSLPRRRASGTPLRRGHRHPRRP